MKILSTPGGSRVDLIEIPDPEPEGRYVVVKVMASSVCGTERHTYEDGPSPAYVADGVVNVGHEATGVVWKVAPGSRLKEGDRVNLFASVTHCGTCRHCMA
ncbi:MAG: alcohol dehydrogenase catalytic domain-containing protein, partial [Betaproteobacteria bacterium]